MLHRLCGPPSIHLSFNLATVLPRRSTYRVSCATKGTSPPTASRHRLRRGLPGYLILFAPHAFAPQCQIQTRRLPSHLIFLLISKNLTSPLEILSSSFDLKIKCIDCKPNANNWNGTINNNYPPTCPLRPIILNNTCSSCLTAAAGTEFAGASF